MLKSARRALRGTGIACLFAASYLAAHSPAWANDPTVLSQPWAKWNYTDDNKPTRGGTLRLAAPLYIGKMNPNHWPVNDWLAMNNFHEKLMITNGEYHPTVNWLSESTEFTSPTEVVMKLRKGVTFHDGSPLNAESLRRQVDWIRNPDSGAWSASWLEPLKSIEVVDESTVRWTFKEPWAGFTGIVANVPGYAMGMDALEKLGEGYDNNPVGTGPYIIEDAKPDNYLKLKRNPNWWFAKASGNPDMPYFDGIQITIIPDAAVRLANLRAGKIDMLTVDKAQYAAIKDDPNLNVYRVPVPTLVGLRFNTTKGVFKDKRLREAVSLAIDRKALIAGTQFGLGRIASAMYPEDHWAHNPDLQPVAFDPERAKQLLAEAGHANGLTIRGYFVMTSSTQGLVEAIKNMLAKVGIDWQVDQLAPVAASARMKEADYDLAQGGWTYIYDPHLLASGSYHPAGGFNFGRSNNEEAIKLIDAGRKEVDPEKRQKIYWDLEKVIYDDYQDVFLYWEEAATAMSKNLQGYDHEMWKQFKEVYTWSHPLWFKDGKN